MASDFLKKKALESRKRIDANVGSQYYGGSAYVPEKKETSLPNQIDPQNVKQNYKGFGSMSPAEQMKIISGQRTEKTIPVLERMNKEKRDLEAEREARRYSRPVPVLPLDQFEIDRNIPISEHTTFDTKGQIQNKKYNLQVDALRKNLEAVQELPDFYQVTEQGKNRAKQMAKEPGVGTRYYEEAAKYAASPEYGDFLAISNTIPELSTKRLSKMTDTEKNVLLYYIGTGDTGSAKKYYDEVLERELNKRHQVAFNQGMEELANKHKIIGALGNILTSPGQSVGVLEAFRQNIENLITGQDKPVDAYSPAMSAIHFGNSTAQGITRDMNAFESLLVQTGLSLGQMAMTLPFGETGSLLLMSSEAAGNAVLDATQRGASAPKALASGLLAGAIEFGTEKLPIDNLFKIAKSGKRVSKNMVKEVLKQTGIEATEELVSEYANTLTDIALMGNKSSYHLLVQELVQSGLSREEAEKQATIEMFVIQPMMAAAGGGLAGGISGGTAAGINVFSDYRQNKSQGQPYLYQSEGEAGAPDMNPVLQKKIEELQMKSIESVITEIDQDPAQAIQNPQNAQTILRPENVETVYEYAKEKYGEKGFEAAKSIIEAANNTMEQSAKDNAVEGENNITPGLVNNEQAKRFNIKSRNTLNEIGKMLGVQIEFSDAEDIGNGYYENRKIVLSTQSENPIRDILRHELTHHFQKMAPQEYEAYCSYVLDVMKKADPEYLESEMGRIKSLYEAQTGKAYTEQAVIDEIVSDFTMNFTDNPEELSRFAKENRNIAQKIVDSLHEIIVKIRSAMEKAFGSVKRDLGESERYNPYGLALEQFEQAEKLWRDALRVSIEEKNDANSHTNRKYSVVQEENKSVIVIDDANADINLKNLEKDMHKKFDKMHGVNALITQIDQSKINLNKRAVGEYLRSDYVFQELPEELRNVVYLSGRQLDEMIQHSVPLYSYPNADKKHKYDANLGWEQRGITLEAPDYSKNDGSWRRYEAQLIVRKNSDGNYSHGIIGVVKKGSASYGASKKDPSIKSAEPLSNNTIAQKNGDVNTSIDENGENDTDFSISTLEREIARLKEQLNYWKGQTKRSKGISFEEKTTLKVAKDILSEYDSGADAAEIAGKIKTLYEYIANGEGKEKGVSWVEVKKQANEIATEIVENAEVLDDSLYHQYSDLRKQLRGNTYYFDPQSRADLEANGGYEAIRKHNMGRFFLSGDSSKTGIDTLYDQLNAEYGSTLFPEEITHPADQLIQISKVLDDIQPVMENPYSAEMQQVIEHVGNQVFDQFFDTPQMKPTFADRQAKKFDENNKRWRQKYDQAVVKERTTREQKLADLRAKHQASDAKARERREAGDLRAKIQRHTAQLSQKLLRPTDKQHIPESMRLAVADMLRSINLESSFVIDPATGKRVKQGTKKAEGVINPETTKRTDAAQELRRQYAEISKDNSGYSLILDPDLLDNLDTITGMKDKRISDMDTKDLQLIWDTVKAIEVSITNENRMLSESRYKNVSGLANKFRDDNQLKPIRRNLRVGSGIDGLINLDMLSPETYFHRFGEAGDEIFRMMRKAEDKQTRILAEAAEYTQEVIGVGKTDKNKVRNWEKKMHSFSVSGGTLELSTAQIMELYNLSKRAQAIEHIYTGGIRPNGDTGKGMFENRGSDPVKVTREDVKTILSALTEEQRMLADKMREFLSGRMAEHGNQASMDVYGYQKFGEKNYWPIQVDKNQTKTEVGKSNGKAVPNYGMTKATTPDANNAVMLGSAFDTYTQHISEMAIYSAWLKTWYDVERLHNFVFRDDGGKTATTVKSLVERVYGKNGNGYLTKLLEDIGRGTKNKADTVFSMDRMISNYKASAVGGNIRVILQQPTSIFRAANDLDWKYLAKAAVKRGDWEKVKKYAPIAQWKDWGYFEINTGRNIKDIITGSDSRLEKAEQRFMEGAGKADSFTWSRLWNACELETADKRPELTRGSESFYQAVADRFTELIDRTQVVDSVMQRTQYMRSSNSLIKMASSFMSEPSKVYNMVIRDFYDLRNAKSPEARKKARKAMARTAFSLIASFAANATAQAIVDAARDDDREKKYWEKLSNSWFENFRANFNPFGYLPIARDIISIVQGYDVSRMDMDSIQKTIQAANAAMKSLSGTGKYQPTMAILNLFSESSRLLGIPVSNVKRFVSSILGTALNETDSYLLQYRVDKALLNPNASVNSKPIMDNLYEAKKNDPEAYKIIYDDMIASGISEKRIEDNMDSRRKEEKEYQEKQQKALGDLQSTVQESQAYKTLSEKEIESAERLIKSYSNYMADPEEVPEDDQKCWKKQKDSGVPLSQYVIYKSFEETKQEDIIKRIQTTFHFSESKAEEMYYKIESYLYPGDDLDEAKEKKVKLCKKYGFTENEYMKAYNALRGVTGTKNRAGKTISGSEKRNKMKALHDAGFAGAKATKMYQILEGEIKE
jgi:hypothetical protein